MYPVILCKFKISFKSFFGKWKSDVIYIIFLFILHNSYIFLIPLLIVENFFSKLISFCINWFIFFFDNFSFLFKILYISLILNDFPLFSKLDWVTNLSSENFLICLTCLSLPRKCIKSLGLLQFLFIKVSNKSNETMSYFKITFSSFSKLSRL